MALAKHTYSEKHARGQWFIMQQNLIYLYHDGYTNKPFLCVCVFVWAPLFIAWQSLLLLYHKRCNTQTHMRFPLNTQCINYPTSPCIQMKFTWDQRAHCFALNVFNMNRSYSTASSHIIFPNGCWLDSFAQNIVVFWHQPGIYFHFNWTAASNHYYYKIVFLFWCGSKPYGSMAFDN